MTTPSESQRSSPLVEIIHDEIRRTGGMTFHRFVDLCLYHASFGYYNAQKSRLGKEGDFFTSAHAAPVFARLLARHVYRWWTRTGCPPGFELVELGPGDGLFAAELLAFIHLRFHDLFASLHYTAVEQSPALRAVIAARLQPFAPRAAVVPDWESFQQSTARPDGCARFVFANEFFDALPFHFLVWRNGHWQERYVGLDDSKLVWTEDRPSNPNLAAQAELRFDPRLPPSEREDGSMAEIRPSATEWMQRICGGFAGYPGELLIVDYGYTIEELQRGRFPQGSALAYRRHQALDDLLENPGDQDLTAHVNFSELMDAGQQCGMKVTTFESQSKFLMDLGEEDQFSDIFSDSKSEAERQRRTQLLKTLILPQGMGEVFRVLQMTSPGSQPK